MNEQSCHCPDQKDLRELLTGKLSDDREVNVTKHMDTCESCQKTLEEIATDGSDLSQVVQHIGDSQPIATSAYWPAMKALATGARNDRPPPVSEGNPSSNSSGAPGPGSDGFAVTTATPPEMPAPVRVRGVSLDFLQPGSDSAYLGRIAQFDVMRVLGRGGMGVVLEAFDSRLQRNVALKVLDPELAGDDVAKQRFCREARAAASITHENVVAVHQVERANDGQLPYLVMQLISGESLEQRLSRETKLSFDQIVRISLQAARGLQAAHAQGLIHRDIKPGNILLESNGDRVKLTDFGLARVAEDVKLTRTGFVTGTPLYMAPEQALGEEADHRSDLFSLGAVMYEMVAGRPPFSGNSALAILKQIADAKHKPVREISPDTPEWLGEMIDELLAKKPADRYQSATDLVEVLDFHWAHMRSTSAELPTVCAIEHRRTIVRNRWIAAGISAAFLALGLLGGRYLLNGGAPITPAAVSSSAPIAELKANAGTVWSVAFDPSGEKAAMAIEDGSVRLWDLPTKSLQATIPAHRGIVWAAKYFKHGDKLLLATAGDDGFIKIWDPTQTEPIKSFKRPNAVRGLAISTDGSRIYAGNREGGIAILSMDNDTPIAEGQQPGAVYGVALSPDGETFATTDNEKNVRLWNATNLSQKATLVGHDGAVYSASFSPDGKRLVTTGWDHKVHVWDVASGTPVQSWDGHQGDIWCATYSPDGTKIASAGADGAVKLWDSSNGNLIATYLGHNASVHTVAFNQDGSQLASGGRDGVARIWKVE